MGKLKFGIVGCGTIAARFAKALAKSPVAELYAVAAREQSRAEAFADAHGAKAAYGDYSSLMEDPEVQAVYIATVHTTHADIAKMCIRAGKPVLCEKPFFVTEAEALEVIALAREKKVLVMEAFWSRTTPAYHRVKKWIGEGKIGDIRVIQAAFCFNVPYNETTRNSRLWKPETAGGALFDAGVYPYQYVTGIMDGAPDDMNYMVQRGPSGVDATVAMTLRYNSGVIAECLTSICTSADSTAVISGSDGLIKQYYFVGSRKCELYDRRGNLVESYEDPEEEGFVHEIAHFAQLYAQNKTESDLIPLKDNLDFVRAAERILSSDLPIKGDKALCTGACRAKKSSLKKRRVYPRTGLIRRYCTMQLGLKRGAVELLPHQISWEENAGETIRELKAVLGDTAVDIQHIGSTSIRGICAKPIVDLVIGVRDLDAIKEKIDALEKIDVIFRGQDHPGQLLFVKGDFAADTRTHHIHVVVWGGESWVNYLNFRDYLNTFSEKAAEYDALKKELLTHFAQDRGSYTSGKQALIDTLLKEARQWRAQSPS